MRCTTGTILSISAALASLFTGVASSPLVKREDSSFSATLAATTSSTPALLATINATFGSTASPKILLRSNTFELGYLTAYNFTVRYTGPLFDSVFACTEDGQICSFACGQELVSACQVISLMLIPEIDLTKTYIIIDGIGGVNPKHVTAGGATISTFSIQWEWGGMFLGDDLPANFSGQYFYSYAQLLPIDYPSTVPFEDVASSGQELRVTYEYEAAQRAPSLARCDVVSAQTHCHGKVAGENVEYYTDIVTTRHATPCHTNQDDQGRVLGLFLGAVHKKLDWSRVFMIKAFSNFDRPPPQLTAYQSRYFVGEAATEPGLRNMWAVTEAVIDDILAN